MSHKKVAAVVLNYRSWEETIICIETLLQSSYPLQHIIIVDNNSQGLSVQRIREWAKGEQEALIPDSLPGLRQSFVTKPVHLNEITVSPHICGQLPLFKAGSPLIPGLSALPELGVGSLPPLTLALLSQNRGYAAGNNLGMALGFQLGADAILLCNNDIMLASEAPGYMVERLYSSKTPGLCGALVVHSAFPHTVQCCAGGSTSKWTGLSRLMGAGLSVACAQAIPYEQVERKLEFIYGACVMVTKEFVQTIGWLDERYFLYSEEQDWAWANNKRFSLCYAKEALVYHKEGGSTGWPHGQQKITPLWRIFRSRMLLHRKFFPETLPTVFVTSIFALFRKIFQIGWSAFFKKKEEI